MVFESISSGTIDKIVKNLLKYKNLKTKKFENLIDIKNTEKSILITAFISNKIFYMSLIHKIDLESI